MVKIGIIGAGAAGLMAAITAAERGACVTLLEKNSRVGKKILMTGNGKCNLGNLDFDIQKYYCGNPEKLEKIFREFAVAENLDFWKRMGLLLRERDGYLYPYCEQAAVVLDILRKRADELLVQTKTDACMDGIRFDAGQRMFVLTKGGDTYAFDRLIIAAGSPASQRNGEGWDGYRYGAVFGHKEVPLVPALVPLKSREAFLKGVSGVRVKGRVTLLIDGKEENRQEGEIQFTDYGISGIAVFQMSRQAAYALAEERKTEILLDLFPDKTEDVLRKFARARYEGMQKKEAVLEDYLLGLTHKKLNLALLKRAGYRPDTPLRVIGKEETADFLTDFKRIRIRIDGTRGFENAQVCAGGISLDEVDMHLQSQKQTGLYFAGEILDVDGICGGYNLQWAWTSGFVAGKYAADSKRM